MIKVIFSIVLAYKYYVFISVKANNNKNISLIIKSY